MIIVGGAFLLAPGFITDVIGFALLIPPTRAVFRAVVARLARRRVVVHRSSGPPAPASRGSGPAPGGPRPRARAAATTTRAPRARSTERPEIEPGERVSEIVALEFEAPAGERLRFEWLAGRAGEPRARPPRRAARLAARRRARLGRDRGGAGALRAARRRSPAGDRRPAPGGRPGPRRRARGRRARDHGELRAAARDAALDRVRRATAGRAGSGSSSTASEDAIPIRVAGDATATTASSTRRRAANVRRAARCARRGRRRRRARRAARA